MKLKKIVLPGASALVSGVLGLLGLAATVNSAAESSSSLYDLEVTNVSGEVVSLGQYRGQVALVVNTASQCGFTSQYAGLQALYEKYRERGFVVLAFPSNDFGGQEPGSNQEIKKFCELRYKTTFPVFSKGAVKGEGRQPVYHFLTVASADEFRGDPGWNFVKFLVNRKGHVVGRFSSMTAPDSGTLTRALEEELNKPVS